MTDATNQPGSRARSLRADLRAEKLPAAEQALENAITDVHTAEAARDEAQIAFDSAIAGMLAAGATWAEVREKAGIPHRSVQRALYRVDGRALGPAIRSLTARQLLKHPDFQWLHNPTKKGLDPLAAAKQLVDAANGNGDEIGWIFMHLIEQFGSRPARPAARG